MRRVGIVTALLLAAVAIALVLFVHSTTPPTPGAFYRTPLAGPLPPGAIVNSEPVQPAPAGTREWRILYVSRSYTRAPRPVSGLLFVPTGAAPAGGRPVIVSTHGTIGVASGCVGSNRGPSYWPAIDGLHEFLRRGYVVVAPDYEGLGTPGPHPYLVGDSEAWAALDAVRAARMFPAAEAGDRFAAFGASQGGQAALFTGQLARSYAPELKLVGVAAAAPATDLLQLFKANPNGTLTRVLASYTLATWSRVYPQLRLDQVLKPLAIPIVNRIAGICVAIDERSTVAAGLLAQLLRISYLERAPWDTEPWKGLIERNSPGGAEIRAPLLITQGAADKLVRPSITRSFVDRACARGERISYREFAGVNHVDAGPKTAGDVASWIADRFAGKPAPTTCR